jgi:intracellular multiplication protein IcmJ
MRLRSLQIKVGVPEAASSVWASKGDPTSEECAFCGQRAGLRAMRLNGDLACVLCGLVQSLHRPTIDAEIRLIWLPEMSQAALNVLVRQIHIELRALGNSVYCDDVPKYGAEMRRILYTAQRLLLQRGETVSERLGSSQPSDLADALTVLASRHANVQGLPLGGLRIFAAGRFFIDGADVYGEVVDSWRDRSAFEQDPGPAAVTAEVA